MIYKRNIFQKAVSLLLTVSLLVPGMGATARAEAPVEPVEKPQLRVVGTLTDGGKYLELGLSIDGKAASFQSAGVLLKYDATMLTPLKWGTIEDESGVPADAKIPVLPATAVSTAWNKATVLPTKSKGADDLVGKTAKAVKLPGVSTSAYLFLGAEAPKGRTLKQLLPVETGTTPEGLPTATASGKPITAIGAADAPADQVVTVRFLVGTTTDAGEGAVERNYTLAELVAAIDLVVYDPTSATPDANERALLLASPLALSMNANTKLEGLSYIADNTDYTTAGVTTAADVSFLWVAAGQTVDSGGGSSTEGIVAVTAFDWDGTMLGSFIFATDANPDKQLKNAQEALDVFMALDDVKAKLTSHAGYDFLAWVKNEDDVPTSYGKRVASTTNTLLADLALESNDEIDFSMLSQSATVKAAYTTNESCTIGNSGNSLIDRDARRYTTSIESYNRFGTSNSFSIKIKVERGSVPRTTQGALWVRMEINGISVYSQYQLSGADVEVVEVAPFAQSNKSTGFKGVSTVEWTIVDNFENSNWVGAAARTTLTECQSLASFTVKTVGAGATTYAVWDEGTYPFYGVVAGINNTLEEFHKIKMSSDDPDSVQPSNANMAGVTAAILQGINIPPKTTNALQIRIAVYDGWVANGMKDMDYKTLYEVASGVSYMP